MSQAKKASLSNQKKKYNKPTIRVINFADGRKKFENNAKKNIQDKLDYVFFGNPSME